MKKIAISFWLLAFSLGCMTSAMVSDLPEVSPTVTVVDQSADVVSHDELQYWNQLPREYVVCVDALHVRSGPRVEASVVDWLEGGEVVTVSEMWEGWGMIDKARWVRLKYLC